MQFSVTLRNALERATGPDDMSVISSAHGSKNRFLRETLDFLPNATRSSHALFPNYFLPPTAAFHTSVASTVVVHDLQYLRYPQYFSPAKRLWLDATLRFAKQFAALVIFISNATERDFLERFGEPRLRRVIYNPVDVHSLPARNASFLEPFILCSYHHYPHKRFDRILELFDELASSLPSHRLVITGHGREDVLAAATTLRKTTFDRVTHLGYVSRQELAALMSESSAFVSMSEFEGFNLSAAEAATIGTPLILSDIPVHRELFAGVALFADADIDTKKIAKFITNRARTQWPLSDACRPDRVAKEYISALVAIP